MLLVLIATILFVCSFGTNVAQAGGPVHYDNLTECVYAANKFDNICCPVNSTACNPAWCQCPLGWDCVQNICTTTCNSFLLQTGSGNPRDSFTNCENRSDRKGMPNCECPNSDLDGVESVCIADFHHDFLPNKLCSYRKYYVPGKGNRAIGYSWRRRPSARLG